MRFDSVVIIENEDVTFRCNVTSRYSSKDNRINSFFTIDSYPYGKFSIKN